MQGSYQIQLLTVFEKEKKTAETPKATYSAMGLYFILSCLVSLLATTQAVPLPSHDSANTLYEGVDILRYLSVSSTLPNILRPLSSAINNIDLLNTVTLYRLH